MMKGLGLALTLGVAAGATAIGRNPLLVELQLQTPPLAKGHVFHDVNGNGRRDSGERGIPGVLVSDQTQIVRTNRDGYWQMPTEMDDDTIYFVVKPRNWMTPLDEFNKPLFYYIHKPRGSKTGTRFKGVDPTGPLPASIDFPLTPVREPGKYDALMFGDTQPRDLREVDYIRRDVIEPLIGQHNARFGATMGDIVFDDLAMFEPLARVKSLLGVPWYHVLGNHDIQFDVRTDDESDDAWERFFGPNYYAFQHGPVHFFALDNIFWEWPEGQQNGRYRGVFGEKQISFVRRYLELIPRNEMVVLLMHIPLQQVQDREAMYRVIEGRKNAISISAHTHFHENVFIDEQMGWKGRLPHHHINLVTVSGSWWQGAPDEFGIPHTTMRDGGPNGHTVFTFEGENYSYVLKAARRHENFQMLIHSADVLDRASVEGAEVVVNVFAGSSRSKVEMSLDGGPWVVMENFRGVDPAYAAMHARDQQLQRPFRPLPGPAQTPHLWRGKLPATRKRGLLKLRVRTTDMFGKTYEDAKGITVR